MINPQELRIGNYVNSHKGYAKVLGILCDSIETETHGDILDNFDPIPITPDILERCGFAQNATHKRFWHNKKLRYSTSKNILDIDTGWRNGEGIGWMPVKIDYLHHLQNIIYSLTNKELTFKTTTHERK